MARKFLGSRIALAIALSSGLAVAVAPPAMAKKKEKAAAPQFSDEFRKAAAPIEKAMTDATKKLPAGAGPNEYAAAQAEIDAALGGDGKAAFEAAVPAATTPDDKHALGSFMRNYGILAKDLAFKQKGNLLMLESGKLSPESVGAINFDSGVTAYQLKDWANAAKYLRAAKAVGYQDPNNQLDMILVDAYKRSGNTEAVLQMADEEIAAAQASGTAPSETTLRNALQQTYSAKQVGPSAKYASLLGRYYPAAWGVAISVVGQIAALPREQDIDLMRLKYLTKSMTEKADYFTYLEDVDPRAYPGEALKIINDGLAKGVLTEREIEADKTNTSSRVAQDKASLPSVASDANKAGAKVGVVVGAGDVFLSYDQPAQAETFYAKALGMPGVDVDKATLRLAMAQALQGKYTEAEANFAKVKGSRIPVAQMWTGYVQSKAAPVAAAAPAN
ncbi:hypothetical protein [Novosphingobium mangrovi (ex Huang et al. 2023)]|uniref:Tetratricopeptide repeat protein n=1 Tax=Novosphingobium mangrovi (ex Huang et al. 2023) TaxID=2976432 RepID=A0ABT2I437_9SPHN|nr:hypothetical protein [Novosphingobium mangrovi (ex Huang et al. 2023)]MCT2399575.1 hypothetical protein [Novosphingobium mangrovi (ex Huang et al. 2023)]